MTGRPRLVFFGTPEFAQTVLTKLFSQNLTISLVVTRPDRPAGRSQRLHASPVATFARQQGLPLEQPSNPNAILPTVVSTKSDVLIVASYGTLLKQTLLEATPHGALNVHASLLPAYRGASPVQQVILDGKSETGVTIMKLDEGLDTGPIVAKQRVPMAAADTAGSLSGKLAEAGATLLCKTLPAYLAGKVEPRAQDEKRASMTNPLTKQDGLIDWRKDASYLVRHVRAMQPWPGAYSDVNGKTIKILAAHAISKSQMTPGSFTNSLPLTIGTGHGSLVIDKLQTAGKRPVTGAAWLRGYQKERGQFSL